MRHMTALLLGVVIAAGTARAATVNFTASLNGANERPDPVDTPATGTATAQLTGDTGSFVLTYQVSYENLTSEAVGGHIHATAEPVGAVPTEQFGPIVHPLDSILSPITGDWRFDDPSQPLTDTDAANLLAGQYYINIHSANFPDGEIRGQLVPEQVAVIPLPAPLATGLVGLSAAALGAWRRKV
jgi:hypothetical protein